MLSKLMLGSGNVRAAGTRALRASTARRAARMAGLVSSSSRIRLSSCSAFAWLADAKTRSVRGTAHLCLDNRSIPKVLDRSNGVQSQGAGRARSTASADEERIKFEGKQCPDGGEAVCRRVLLEPDSARPNQPEAGLRSIQRDPVA